MMSDLALPEELWETLRHALRAVCPEDGIAENRPFEAWHPGQFLLTGRARAAMSLDTFLVIGDRGAGKTELFRLLVERSAGLAELGRVRMTVGFARRRGDADPPDPDSLYLALRDAKEHQYRLMWLGLLARALRDELHEWLDDEIRRTLAENNPRQLLHVMEAKSHKVNEALARLDERLHTQGETRVVLYDDFDVLMPTWAALFGPLRGLFSLWQERSRSWRRLRPKVFLRKDLFEAEATYFPDSAKFFAARQTTLQWSEADLYALLLKRLLNYEPVPESVIERPAREPLRWDALHRWLVALCGGDEALRRDPVFGIVPERREGLAGAFTEAVAGLRVGEGVTASPSALWVKNHVSDGLGEAAPRPMLRLFSRAAELAANELQPATCIPSFCFIRAQRAVSDARLQELKDEDPWLTRLPPLMKGAKTPITADALAERLAPLLSETDPSRRPPCVTPTEVVERLLKRGVLNKRTDGRLDVPELFRVGLEVSRDSAVEAPLQRPSLAFSALIDRLFCERDAPYGPYQRPSVLAEEEVLPELMVRARLLSEELQPVTVQLYRDVDSFGGELWSREVRALMQLSAQRHPALPSVRSGAYDETQDVAFVITDAADYSLAEPNAMEFVALNPIEALRQLLLITHGLGLLHERGITHRNLNPATVEFVQRGESPEAYSLRLIRFEMSTMVSNALRRQLRASPHDLSKVREIYGESLGRWLPYCPPERVAWILSDNPDESYPETDREDVYALGVLAWRWLIEPKVTAAALRQEAAALWEPCEPTPEGARAARVTLVQGLTNAAAPGELKELLRAMLNESPPSRPSVAEVLRRLSGAYGMLAAALSPDPDPRPYHVGFMPEESHKTLLNWGWIDKDPNDATGQEELRQFLAKELSGAELLFSPKGFSTFRTPHGEKETRAFTAAKFVLRGRQGFWFCDLYFPPGPAFRAGSPAQVDQLLLIKYVCHHRHAWRLDESPLRRHVPGELKLIPVWASRSPDLSALRESGADWRPLVRSVEQHIERPAWLITMDQALSFLLQVRRAQLDARCFPVTVTQEGDRYNLALDEKRDKRYTFGDALRSLYFRRFRRPMGQIYREVDNESGTFTLFADDGRGWPDRERQSTVFLVDPKEGVLDTNTVQVKPKRGHDSMPDLGWVRPTEDHGEESQLRRQTEATETLRGMLPLLEQLHDPRSIQGPRRRWAKAGEKLRGRSHEIVQDMLRSTPFFALHGPPGTGKTTVAATALVAALRADPGLRVLVTSQSHYALDNLGERVLKECRKQGVGPVTIRVGSDDAVANEKISPGMARYLPERQAEAQMSAIGRRVEQILQAGSLADGTALKPELIGTLRQWSAQWSDQSKRLHHEVRDRLRRGANLVFATTGASTDKNLGIGDGSATFDWVIVEEAARAWPTELALPLVRGRRWTLIGDHLQLPAFDEKTVKDLLRDCLQSDDEELRAHGDRATNYLKTYSVFGSLFDGRAERSKRRSPSSRLHEPLDELDLQFRMHPDIAEVVSRAFYNRQINKQTGESERRDEGWLKSDESTRKHLHGLHAPGFLKDRALIWLDTEGCPDGSTDERAWSNKGEAEVVKRLLERMRPSPKRDDEERFAMLTPYLSQRDLLRGQGLPEWAKPHIHTVDSFQGREADIVVVSMVRSNNRKAESPEGEIGYLVSPNRVNVMFSRARKLLVIVGRFSHFEGLRGRFHDRRDIEFWADICGVMRARGALVSAKDTLYGGVSG